MWLFMLNLFMVIRVSEYVYNGFLTILKSRSNSSDYQLSVRKYVSDHKVVLFCPSENMVGRPRRGRMAVGFVDF